MEKFLKATVLRSRLTLLVYTNDLSSRRNHNIASLSHHNLSLCCGSAVYALACCRRFTQFRGIALR
jgi:hypothetical protein